MRHPREGGTKSIHGESSADRTCIITQFRHPTDMEGIGKAAMMGSRPNSLCPQRLWTMWSIQYRGQQEVGLSLKKKRIPGSLAA